MRLLDLFAGIGGFSLAAHWLGWETAAFVERDKFCKQVLRKNFGDVPIYDDICTFDGRAYRGAIDVISGGFPCQPFSVAGKQKGKDDERHLFPQMLRVISEVRPRWIVAENVRGLLNIDDGRVFEEICSHLESEDYSVQTYIVPASAVDAPHRRDRVWIIAHAENVLCERNAGNLPVENEFANRPARSNERLSAPGGTDRVFIADADRDGHRRRRSGKDTSTTRTGESEGHQRKRIRAEFNGNDPIIANADHARDRARRIRTNRNGQTPCVEREFPLAESSRHDEDVTDAEGRNGRAGLCKAGSLNNRRQSRNGDRNVADTGDTRRQGNEFAGALGEGTRASRPTTERFANESWIEAATRFCRMDDVVPDRMDRLKSLGNAVVPLVVYEIFRAIEETEHAEI